MYAISQLYYHPIKSLGSILTDQFSVGPCGPMLDRRIMLVDPTGTFITQRQAPLMSLISVNDLGCEFRLTYQDDSILLPWPNFSTKTKSVLVDVWGEKINGQLMPSAGSSWLSAILNKEVRLVYMDDSEHRQVDLEYVDKGVRTGFADGFPFLLISQASIDFISEKVGYGISVQRFRPNIVVSGCQPFEEDGWRKIKIGQIEFDIVKSCSRCVIPTINLQTAEKDKAVMQVMLDYRKKGAEVFVGQNLVHRQLGILRAGQPVTVLE
jgi:uncharacterized protein YcbX